MFLWVVSLRTVQCGGLCNSQDSIWPQSRVFFSSSEVFLMRLYTQVCACMWGPEANFRCCHSGDVNMVVYIFLRQSLCRPGGLRLGEVGYSVSLSSPCSQNCYFLAYIFCLRK